MTTGEPGGESLRVLVLEDDREACEAVKRFLQFRGHEVDSASTAVGALCCAGRRPPEVAVCDWKLGGDQDGVDAAACLQRRYRTDVILVSAHRIEDLKRKARISGVSVSAYRRKPLSLARLADAIEATGRARRAALVARAS
jgi:DNA-binding response OmpR family regulator